VVDRLRHVRSDRCYVGDGHACMCMWVVVIVAGEQRVLHSRLGSLI
jgi:hypothetical protein